MLKPRELSNQDDSLWSQLSSIDTTAYSWDKESTYILKPPFLEKIGKNISTDDISEASILAILGDNVTTDHISPGRPNLLWRAKQDNIYILKVLRNKISVVICNGASIMKL